MLHNKTKTKLSKTTKAACASLGLAASLFSLTSPVVAQDLSETIAKAAGIPQIDAFLPSKYNVAEAAPSPIDGVWLISAINKRIHIEKGRAYAVDPWLHLFTLKVQPDMVVMQNFQRLNYGQYKADDLPLLGPATLQLRPDGNLSVTVQGTLGPAAYTLIKREADYPEELQAEIVAMTGGTPPPSFSPPNEPSPPVETPAEEKDPFENCQVLDVDSTTGKVFCAD